jgi:dipeptidyl aminopeptidase/acylaminoacyl peptidase
MTKFHFARIFLLAAGFIGVIVPAAMAQQHSPANRIQIPRDAPGKAQTITFREIVTLREVQEPQISPDGKRVAFVVRQAFVEANDYRSALYVMDARPGATPVKLLEGASISGVRWLPDGKSISYVASTDGNSKIWKIAPEGGAPVQVIPQGADVFKYEHSAGVFGYEWSPDGTRVAFLTSAHVTKAEQKASEAQGILYHDGLDFLNITEKSWIKKAPELWIYDVREQKQKKVWEHINSVGGIEYTESVSGFLWSPSGKEIAIIFRPTDSPEDSFNRSIGMLSLETGKFSPFVTTEGYKFAVSWSPDSKALAFSTPTTNGAPRNSLMRMDDGILVQKVSEQQETALVPVLNGRAGSTWWNRSGDTVIVNVDDRSSSALYEVSASGKAMRKITQGSDHLSDCSMDAARTKAICIRQNTMTPPDLAVIDLADGVPHTLTNLNAEYKNVTLGNVSEMRWANKYGDETNGFLIKPVGYVSGQRYPFLLTLYGFSGTFISQSEWISSYPAQAFAANGFVVLLMNYPKGTQGYRHGDFEEASRVEAYSPLASMEAAVQMLSEQGLIDPDKKGIMGWSYGSFLTDFTISHTDWFQAAASGDGGRENPSRYWMNTGDYQFFDEGIYGGSPFGQAANNYAQLAPALNASKVRAPVFMEYAQRIWGLEFYTAVKKTGGQAELIFYPDEDHIFFQPKHRMVSLERNLDWFSFWLKGTESSDPAKAAQYVRWRAMREQIAKRDTAAVQAH